MYECTKMYIYNVNVDVNVCTCVFVYAFCTVSLDFNLFQRKFKSYDEICIFEIIKINFE